LRKLSDFAVIYDELFIAVNDFSIGDITAAVPLPQASSSLPLYEASSSSSMIKAFGDLIAPVPRNIQAGGSRDAGGSNAQLGVMISPTSLTNVHTADFLDILL
jgi:hypothetical protein